jgi:S-formylglutathione hydrolase FrmB
MKTLLILGAMAFCIVMNTIAQNDDFRDEANIFDTSFYSPALNSNMDVRIYLPPGYDDHPDWYYPVIYYLHPWKAGPSSMTGFANLAETYINDGTIDPVIILCADNFAGPLYGTYYVNSILWGNYEDCMTNDLITWVDSSFRTMPYRDYRGLYGHSMGCYGSFRYGILHKDKFKALAGSGGISSTDTNLYMNILRDDILAECGGTPPYFYDFFVPGASTQILLFTCGAFSPDTNTTQTYINPPIMDFLLDDYGNYIDSVMQKLKEDEIFTLIHQLSPSDSVGILHACGTNDDLFLYPCHVALCDTMDMLGLPYEFFSHTGGHIDPIAFRQRALIFLDSLLMPPGIATRIESPAKNNPEASLEVYPNPFSQETNIRYDLSCPGDVYLTVFNQLGQEIALLLKTYQQTGRHTITFDGSGLPAGIYFCRLKAGRYVSMVKMAVVR